MNKSNYPFGSPIFKFRLVVPDNYNHDEYIDQCTQKIMRLESTYGYSRLLTSENFANASKKLEHGKTYIAEILPILSEERVSGDECIAFYKRKKAIMTGAHGLLLAYNQMKKELPKCIYIASFDEKEALLLWSGQRGVPGISTLPGDKFEFQVYPFTDKLHGHDCILCIYKE